MNRIPASLACTSPEAVAYDLSTYIERWCPYADQENARDILLEVYTYDRYIYDAYWSLSAEGRRYAYAKALRLARDRRREQRLDYFRPTLALAKRSLSAIAVFTSIALLYALCSLLGEALYRFFAYLQGVQP